MGVSGDAPDLDIAYKLAEYAGKGRLKLSSGKPVLPGRKQVFRVAESERDVRDVIGRVGEALEGRPLLEPVMRNGKRVSAAIPIVQTRNHARAQIARLPEHVQANEPADPPFPVDVSADLLRFQASVRDEVADGPRSR